MTRFVRRGIARVMLPVLRRAGRAYIAGPDLEDAVAVAKRLASRGLASTLAFWDGIDAAAEQVWAANLGIVGALRAECLDCYLSVKAPSMKYDLGRFQQLLEACGNSQVRLHFDSLGTETANPTFALVSALLPKFPNVTCTLPGRWLRSPEDAEWAVVHRVGVRIVKGQWEDPAAPMTDPQQGYLSLVEKLAGRARHVAVATHNPLLARVALQRLLDAGTPCELEMLFGLPVESAMRVAKNLGVPVRLYVPFGYGWLPYSLSQARNNPRILWWMFKDMMHRNSSSGIYSTAPS